MTQAPRLIGSQVTLRPHTLDDVDAFWTFYTTTDRAAHVAAPTSKTHLWYGLGSEIASWSLLGYGAWAIETAGQPIIGQIAITYPPHFPEAEIGWTLFDGYEGHGLAYEASALALTWAAANTSLTTLVSYIDPDNSRSIRLAERLGATLDRDAAAPTADALAKCSQVYRHHLEAWT